MKLQILKKHSMESRESWHTTVAHFSFLKCCCNSVQRPGPHKCDQKTRYSTDKPFKLLCQTLTSFFRPQRGQGTYKTTISIARPRLKGKNVVKSGLKYKSCVRGSIHMLIKNDCLYIDKVNCFLTPWKNAMLFSPTQFALLADIDNN